MGNTIPAGTPFNLTTTVVDLEGNVVSTFTGPRGLSEGKEYVLCGGSWKSPADALRSAYRIGENPGFSDACLARDAIGFCCVRKAPAENVVQK